MEKENEDWFPTNLVTGSRATNVGFLSSELPLLFKEKIVGEIRSGGDNNHPKKRPIFYALLCQSRLFDGASIWRRSHQIPNIPQCSSIAHICDNREKGEFSLLRLKFRNPASEYRADRSKESKFISRMNLGKSLVSSCPSCSHRLFPLPLT